MSELPGSGECGQAADGKGESAGGWEAEEPLPVTAIAEVLSRPLLVVGSLASESSSVIVTFPGSGSLTCKMEIRVKWF